MARVSGVGSSAGGHVGLFSPLKYKRTWTCWEKHIHLCFSEQVSKERNTQCHSMAFNLPVSTFIALSRWRPTSWMAGAASRFVQDTSVFVVMVLIQKICGCLYGCVASILR
ncbi:uncharacterized protein LOC119307224 [Triticum dicoccoides]|uniref:uncharacterized protein LOC119307224 n=1 Tax=Triticum dicoccoides TaxID=85692 RepID=UPI00188F50E2|nr:uncharacterized protein LOC119307224 [Triticum dicoccoides]